MSEPVPARRRRRMSLRTQLVLVLVAFTAVVLAVQDVPLAAYLRGVERDRIITGLERDAFTLAGRSQTELLTPSATAKSGLEQAVARYARASTARVVVTDADGTAVVTSDRGSEGDVFDNRPEIATALGGRSASGQRRSATLDEELLYVAVPVRAGSQILGTVRLTYPASAVTAAVDKRVRGLAVVGLVTLGSAAVIGLLVASAVTRRLRRFERTAERITDGDLTARVGPQSSRELDALGSSFDEMAARVEHLVARQRGFAADASHQLRTPLTVMRLRLDRTAELVETDPQAALDNLDAVREETDRMQRLVDGLLTLARADGPELTALPVDVAEIVRERAESWQAFAEERDVVVVVTGAPPGARSVWALAIPGTVEQIVDNYVDNAIEVAPPGTTVELAVEHESARTGATPTAVVVRVGDRGPGLPEVDRARAFDRFWRGTTGESGSGLGLAIVRALADASEASVALEERPGGGIVAVLRLRLAASPVRPRASVPSDPEVGPADAELAHQGPQHRE